MMVMMMMTTVLLIIARRVKNKFLPCINCPWHASLHGWGPTPLVYRTDHHHLETPTEHSELFPQLTGHHPKRLVEESSSYHLGSVVAHTFLGQQVLCHLTRNICTIEFQTKETLQTY